MSQNTVNPTSTGPGEWLEEHFGARTIWRTVFQRHIPFGVNIFYTLGFACVALFLVQAVTGVVLAMYYSPSPDHAYDSIQYITNQVTFGQVIRSIHHAGASAMVIVVALHALVSFVMAAYKRPREFTWVLGVGLLLLTLAFGFTGYLLPWDEKAYWATTVGTNIAGTVPFIGGFLVRVLRGGDTLGTLTLTRFFAAHVLLLPAALATLIGMHLYLVIRLGVSVPPRLWDRAVQEAIKSREAVVVRYQEIYQGFKDRALAMPVHAGSQEESFQDIYEGFEGGSLAAPVHAGHNGESYQEIYQDFEDGDQASVAHADSPRHLYQEIYQGFKDRGRTFFPDLIFEDALVSVGVILIVILAAVVIGAPLEARADPTNMAYVPRPEWYFMFLFQMLKYFPGGIEWVGAILVPSLVLILAIALPFLDLRPQRAPRSRPIAMAIVTLGVLGIAFLTVQAYQSTPSTQAATPQATQPQATQHLTATQLAGEQLVQTQGCVSCHAIGAKGGQVGPSLDGIGSRHDAAYIASFIANPKAFDASSPMPAFGSQMTHQQIEDVAQYLSTLKK